MTAEPADPARPNNLWEPVPGDAGTHGRFDRRAHRTSGQLWASTHRGLLAAAGLALAGCAAVMLGKRSEK